MAPAVLCGAGPGTFCQSQGWCQSIPAQWPVPAPGGCSRRKLSSELVTNPACTGKMSSGTERQPAAHGKQQTLSSTLPVQQGNVPHLPGTVGWFKMRGKDRAEHSKLPGEPCPSWARCLLSPALNSQDSNTSCGKPRGCPGCSESLGVPGCPLGVPCPFVQLPLWELLGQSLSPPLMLDLQPGSPKHRGVRNIRIKVHF